MAGEDPGLRCASERRLRGDRTVEGGPSSSSGAVRSLVDRAVGHATGTTGKIAPRFAVGRRPSGRPRDRTFEYMTMAREELHHLVDELDEDAVPSAAELLRDLAARRSRQRVRPSWFGALRAGPDFAERSEEILRTELGRPA